MPNANAIVWCDIPVKDLDRAIKFYSDVLGKKVSKEAFGEMKFGLLPHEGESVGGCLILEGKPSADGRRRKERWKDFAAETPDWPAWISRHYFGQRR